MTKIPVRRRWKGTPLNGCSACGEDFTSLELFDAHHVGDHALDFPEHEDGRRCLDAEEMTGRGWVQNVERRWLNPARANRARRTFEKAA
jgi:hypothetical protein